MDWSSYNKTRRARFELPGFFSRRGTRFWILVLFATATLFGLLSFPDALYSPAALFPSSYRQSSFDYSISSDCAQSSVSQQYIRPHTGEVVAPHEDAWTRDRVEAMIARTDGFYTRDWPLQLGWNNVRYIIEAGILHASLINRTLVVPSFVYARSCMFDFDVCSSFAQRFHRGDEIGMGDFQYLPEEDQVAWRLPIQLLLDLPRLRQRASVVTVAEYLRHFGLDESLEAPNGAWDEVKYHRGPRRPTLRILEQPDWDDNHLRVDHNPTVPARDEGPIWEALKDQLGGGRTLGLDHAQRTLRDHKLATWSDLDEFERILHENGWMLVHSFRGSFVEMFKAVVEWETEVVMISQLKGFKEEFYGSPEDVIHVQGETHWNRKAGQMRFTTAQGRTYFASLVLHGVAPIPPVQALGDRLAHRMQDLNGGRQYVASHMRRGDFAVLGWSSSDVESHVARIMDRLQNGLKSLEEWTREPPRTAEVPGINPDQFFGDSPLPRSNDKFFLATDAKEESERQYARTQGAVLIEDLITADDRRFVGWPLLFGDILAQVEQEIATRAAFFYGHSMSSVAGGIANLRAARGKDLRTCYID